MKEVSGLFDHDVVIVSITYSQHIGGDTVASTGRGEVVYSLLQIKIEIITSTTICEIYHIIYSSSIYIDNDDFS